jgi:hypothetical protein
MQDTTEAPKQYQCRHIFTDGRRCASPCLRKEEFCYYHHTTRRPVANPQQRRGRRSAFHLPLPDPNDRSGIQIAIGEVLQRIAANEIDPRRAGLLLYGLQIASLNLGKTQPATRTSDERETVETVEEITIDPALGILAPQAEISKPAERKSSVALMIERMLQEQEASRTTQPQQPAEPAIVPTLQATEDSTISLLENTEERSVLKGRGFRRPVCPHQSTRLQPPKKAFNQSSLHLVGSIHPMSLSYCHNLSSRPERSGVEGSAVCSG